MPETTPEPRVNAASPAVIEAIEAEFREAVRGADNEYTASVTRAARLRDRIVHIAAQHKFDALIQADADARADAAHG